MENYTKIIEEMKARESYFRGIEFNGIASDYSTMIRAIENLLEEIQRLREKANNDGTVKESV